MTVLPALALLATFEPSGGVAVSCLENVRGKQGRARVEVVVGVGAVQETEQERGVAHLLEHLALRPLGFDDGNGATGWDYTTYHRDVRAEELLGATTDLLEQLVAPKLDAEDVDVEKRIVLRELDDRGTSHLEQAQDPLFEGTALARYPGGTADAVQALNPDAIRAFHDRHYVKGNVAVLLRGAVDCAAARAALAPVLDRFPDGPATALTRVRAAERGAVTLPAGAGDVVAGYYWYDADPGQEVLYQLVAKHLEQSALQHLRKERGITYSPSARFLRRARGGQLMLSIRTEGEDAQVRDWFDETVKQLLEHDRPSGHLQAAYGPVREALERDGVRAGLAAIRGEPDPLRVLESLDDAQMKAHLPKLLGPQRAFGSAVPQSNVASLVVLALFGAVVLAALFFAFRAFVSHR